MGDACCVVCCAGWFCLVLLGPAWFGFWWLDLLCYVSWFVCWLMLVVWLLMVGSCGLLHWLFGSYGVYVVAC